MCGKNIFGDDREELKKVKQKKKSTRRESRAIYLDRRCDKKGRKFVAVMLTLIVVLFALYWSLGLVTDKSVKVTRCREESRTESHEELVLIETKGGVGTRAKDGPNENSLSLSQRQFGSLSIR